MLIEFAALAVGVAVLIAGLCFKPIEGWLGDRTRAREKKMHRRRRSRPQTPPPGHPL